MERLSADLIRRSPQFLSAIKERVLDLRGNRIAILDSLGATEGCRATGYRGGAMERLSADLIRRSPQFLSAIKERVLDLRGNRIAILDSLGATEDQFDTIDLLDYPFMNRIGTLLINNNRITGINPNLADFLPNIHTLVLTNNCLTSLAEIDPLSSLPKLQFLSLLGNSITKQPGYRLYVIHKLKHLHLLDFKKVKQQERPKAAEKFRSKETEKATKKTLKDEETRKKYDYAVAHLEGTNMNYQRQEFATWFAEEVFGADLDCTDDTLKSKIELYIYQNFVRVPFNFISSWRKTPLFGMHILPPPRRQEPDDCAYHATLTLMECGFKVMYAKRPPGQPREFNVKLSHKHLKKMVLDYITSEEGQDFKPRDLLRVCLRMVMRHGVVSEEDYDEGRLSWMHDIPGMLKEARMVLTSFRVTPRYRALLPHEIYRYSPAEDPTCQPWTGDKKPAHQSHCVVLTSPGLAYKALEECATEAEASIPERYFEYLNSYSTGYGVDGCGFIFADSIRTCYIIQV